MDHIYKREISKIVQIFNNMLNNTIESESLLIFNVLHVFNKI